MMNIVYTKQILACDLKMKVINCTIIVIVIITILGTLINLLFNDNNKKKILRATRF